MRATIEGMAARLAAEERTAADLEELERLVALSEAAIRDGDLGELQRAHQAFHARIALAAHNEFLLGLLENLSVRAGLTMALSLKRAGRPWETIAEHRRLLVAIAARDPDAAEAAARAHTGNALQSVVGALTAPHDPLMPLA